MPSFALYTILGDQIPVIALLEVDGKVGTAPPEQMLKVVPNEKTGVISVVTSTVKVVTIPHCPVSGVKV